MTLSPLARTNDAATSRHPGRSVAAAVFALGAATCPTLPAAVTVPGGTALAMDARSVAVALLALQSTAQPPNRGLVAVTGAPHQLDLATATAGRDEVQALASTSASVGIWPVGSSALDGGQRLGGAARLFLAGTR